VSAPPGRLRRRITKTTAAAKSAPPAKVSSVFRITTPRAEYTRYVAGKRILQTNLRSNERNDAASEPRP
jgi:hypothetical protein